MPPFSAPNLMNTLAPTPVSSPLPPLPTASTRTAEMQAELDKEHLRLLQISYYILGATTALRLVWLFFLVGMFIFASAMTKLAPHNADNATQADAAAQVMFGVIAVVFGIIGVLTVLFICLEFYAAHCLKQRKNVLVIQIVAALYCLSLPWGTAVGACTFIVLNRPTVRALFR
jgi:hypothetical protein